MRLQMNWNNQTNNFNLLLGNIHLKIWTIMRFQSQPQIKFQKQINLAKNNLHHYKAIW